MTWVTTLGTQLFPASCWGTMYQDAKDTAQGGPRDLRCSLIKLLDTVVQSQIIIPRDMTQGTNKAQSTGRRNPEVGLPPLKAGKPYILALLGSIILDLVCLMLLLTIYSSLFIKKSI